VTHVENLARELAMAKLGNKNKGLEELTATDIEETGLSSSQAQGIYKELLRIVQQNRGPVATWTRISQELLEPSHPYGLHQLLYQSTYKNWDATTAGPPPAWIPSL
jgi:hypothetical protein